MLKKVRSRLTFANVASAIALFLALSTGAAFASHERIFSNDIVNGEVKRPDIAAGAVGEGKVAGGAITRPKLAAGAVTGAKVADNTLTGADVQEGTLAGVNASTLEGYPSSGLVRVSGGNRTTSVFLPDCAPGIDYLGHSIVAPSDGYALVSGSVSFIAPNPGGEGFAARIDKTAPSGVVTGFQEEGTVDPGRTNIAMTSVFAVTQGVNEFSIVVCDSSDNVTLGSGSAIEGQITVVFTPFTF